MSEEAPTTPTPEEKYPEMARVAKRHGYILTEDGTLKLPESFWPTQEDITKSFTEAVDSDDWRSVDEMIESGTINPEDYPDLDQRRDESDRRFRDAMAKLGRPLPPDASPKPPEPEHPAKSE